MTNFSKFMAQVLKAHLEYVAETWLLWQRHLDDALKADVEAQYPDGFKSFLTDRLEADIQSHTKSKKNGKAKADKAA